MSGNEYLRLVNEMRSTTGHAIFWQIDSIAVSHGLFLGNHDELARKLNAHSQFSNVADLHRQDRHQELQAEFREILRLLHNYVAAVKSLVDHTRRIATKLLDASNLDIYS